MSFGTDVIEEMPDGYTGRNGDIKRMFGAALGNFKTYVTLIDNGLVYSVDLVTENEGITPTRLRRKILKLYRTLDLLETTKGVTVKLESGESFGRRGEIGPRYGILGAEGSLVDFGRRRTRADATEHDAFYRKGIASAEDSTDIIKASDIVKHNREMHFFTALELTDIDTLQVPDGLFLHNPV